MSQPESLRLADAWDQAISTRRHVSIGCEMAEELRRLHAENEALKAKLTPLTPGQCVDIADLSAKHEFSDNFLSDICKIVELVEVAHGIVKP